MKQRVAFGRRANLWMDEMEKFIQVVMTVLVGRKKWLVALVLALLAGLFGESVVNEYRSMICAEDIANG